MQRKGHIRVRKNYLEIMGSRLNLTGKRNWRKLLIFQALFEHGNLTAREIHAKAGRDCSYESIRAALTRLVKYRYISRLPEHKYSIRHKGKRFIYAVRELHPDVCDKSIDEVYK